MSIQESLVCKWVSDVAFLEFNLVEEKVNKLSTPIMVRLLEILTELKVKTPKALVLISKKPGIFIAGADIEEIKKMNRPEEYRVALEKAHEIFNMIEDAPFPVIAAIQGACLGGGLELSLACDYRIATDEKATRLGLPEVRLGIVPGFGGCVRLPRVVGLIQGLDIILAGKTVPSGKAFKMGLVDENVPPTLLDQKLNEYLTAIKEGKKGKRQKTFKPRSKMDSAMDSILLRSVVMGRAKKQVLKETKGFYPAPLKALEIIGKTYGMKNRTKALAIEMTGFCEVAVTEVSKHLIDLFYLIEGVKKQTGVSSAAKIEKDISSVGILGAGVMGGGIAQLAADVGLQARMKDISNEAIALGLRSAQDIWKKALEKKRITDYEHKNKLGHLSGGLSYAGFHELNVVVEAIVEDLNIKKKVLAEAEKEMGVSAILATNTSSLSVNEMAKALSRPENFVGMHFFNPVHKMPLVEVIRGEKSSDIAVATIFQLAKDMGKTPVVVKDGPGFLVNRLLIPWMSEALFFLEDGFDAEQVDLAYTHQFGMPMGPFRLLDEVGLDVGMKVLKIFHSAMGDRVMISKLAEPLGKTGRLGKKARKGFYLYDEKGRESDFDRSIYQELGLPSSRKSVQKANDVTEIIQRGIFPMINEAAQALLQERVVMSPHELDLAMIMGTGFPPFRGGLLKYADSLGAAFVCQELELYAAKHGQRFKPMLSLSQLGSSNRKFY